MAFLPPYSPDRNPVEFLRAWLKRHALANFCPANLDALNTAARSKLKSAQHRPSIIAACWYRPGRGDVTIYGKLNRVDRRCGPARGLTDFDALLLQVGRSAPME